MQKKSILLISKVTAVVVLSFTSCSKSELPKNPAIVSENTNQVMGLPSPNLPYEQLSAFPNGPSEIVPAPWATGVGRSFPIEYLDDYSAADGWELYHNTFTAERKTNDPYFIIYNKFRGVMRLYFYMLPRSGAATDVVTFQLDLRGSVNNSSILNFEQGEIIDKSINNTVSTKVQNEKIIQAGSWYAEEFEMAYDPLLRNTSYIANQLRWSMYSTNISTITLDGTQKGTIDGTIQTPTSTGSGLFGSLLKGAVSVGLGKLGVLTAGAKILGNFFSKQFGPLKLDQVKEGIEEAGKGEMKNGGKSIFNAIVKAVKGENGGPGYSEQKVNLKLNSAINLAGNIASSPEGMFNPVVFISGTQGLADIAPDYIPNYTGALGVFNIDNTPSVDIYSIIPPVPEVPTNLKTYIYSYVVDEASFNLQFNQDVINSSTTGASIQNLKKEVVLVRSSTIPNDVVGNTEYLDLSTIVYTGHTGVTTEYVTARNSFPAPTNVYVRISFDVVPANGSAPVKIIKTFKANAVNKY